MSTRGSSSETAVHPWADVFSVSRGCSTAFQRTPGGSKTHLSRALAHKHRQGIAHWHKHRRVADSRHLLCSIGFGTCTRWLCTDPTYKDHCRYSQHGFLNEGAPMGVRASVSPQMSSVQASPSSQSSFACNKPSWGRPWTQPVSSCIDGAAIIIIRLHPRRSSWVAPGPGGTCTLSPGRTYPGCMPVHRSTPLDGRRIHPVHRRRVNRAFVVVPAIGVHGIRRILEVSTSMSGDASGVTSGSG